MKRRHLTRSPSLSLMGEGGTDSITVTINVTDVDEATI